MTPTEVTELRCVRPRTVQEVARMLAEARATGLLDGAEVERLWRALAFRDWAAVYWAIGRQSGGWFAHRAGAWEPAGGPTSLVEAPAKAIDEVFLAVGR